MLKLMPTDETTPAIPRPAKQRVHEARVVLSDLDGCLAAGNVAREGAVELARQLVDRLYLVSNNSSHDAPSLSQELAAHGLEIPAQRIVLAGILAVDTIARRWPGCRIMVCGSSALRCQAQNLGLTVADREVDVVLVARDISFDYRRLEAAANALADGAHLVAANPDGTHPGLHGRLVPETGALLAAIRACVPNHPCTTVGKPEPAIFQEALDLAGCDAADAIMLGDNPATDIAGARALGMDAVLLGNHPDAEVGSVAELVA